MGDDKMNPEGETNIQQEGLEPSQEGVDTSEVIEYISGKENEIGQATIELSKENEKLIDLDKIKSLFKDELNVLEFKLNVLAGDIKEFVGNMTWSKVAKLGSTAALAFIFVSCTNKESTPTPQIMAYQPDAMPVEENKKEEIQVQSSPTVVIEPTATETPPDVDLGLRWEDVAAGFNQSVESMKATYEGVSDKSRYLIFNDKKVFNPVSTYPISEEELTMKRSNGLNMIDNMNDSMFLGLDEQGKNILKQIFLFQMPENKKDPIDVYVYIKDGCFYGVGGKGILTVVWENGLINVYKTEDTPWDRITDRETRNEMEEGCAKVDFSSGKPICSCDVNDVRTSSAEE